MQLVVKEGETFPGLWLGVLQPVLTEGNLHPRAFPVTLVPRINADRVQSAVSLGGSKMKCFFPGSSARSHPLGPLVGAHQGQPRVQAPLGCWGWRAALGKGQGKGQVKVWQLLHPTVPFPFGF